MIGDGKLRWIATCPRSIPPLLRSELETLGATETAEQGAGVEFSGTRATMYRVCLWSRLANRVLLPLGQGPAANGDMLYDYVRSLPWRDVLADGASIAVEFNGTNREIRNTRFGAQRCKDAVVDVFRELGRPVPKVSLAHPDARIIVRLHDQSAEVALDMVGESLHRRGYRRSSGEAPLKENLAAALLVRGGWTDIASADAGLIDPMCGSATFLIEGALMALDQAPALGRDRFAFKGWRGHVEDQWLAVLSDAKARAKRGRECDLPEIRGYDADPRVIRRAQENIAAAELARWVRVSVKALREVKKPTHRPLSSGLVICNPPYGERIGHKESLPQLYRHLGETLHGEFNGWQAAVLVGEKSLGHAIGLRSHRQYQFLNGRIPVTLLLLDLQDNRLKELAPQPAEPLVEQVPRAQEGDLDPGVTMFANRIRKNQRRLKSWLKRSDTQCYRLYDADLPEYAVAVDRYGDWLQVAEYKAPAKVDPEVARRRLAAIRDVLPVATGTDAAKIVFKTRERQRGNTQYQARSNASEMLSVREGQARLLVNLHDYLDTGLFLDHRPLRLRIGAEAGGKRFLNLFCYTGAATVHAALGGAKQTTSVDLSNSHLRWLRQNLAHNGLGDTAHRTERDDVLEWLERQQQAYDLILLDPPSFSNSKKMAESFDVQRDHSILVTRAMARLAADGVMYFSNNRRRFQLDPALEEAFDITDITDATLDPDFPRKPAPHRCWQFKHRSAPAPAGEN